VLLQYNSIREDLLRANPEIRETELANSSSQLFENKYSISIDKANSLNSQKLWDRWLAKHTELFVNTVTSTKLKALDDEHGRFVEYDIITSDPDKANQTGKQRYPDLIPPEVIKNVEDKMIGAIINMNDPSKIADYTELQSKYSLGASTAGIGHEHYFDSSIVPILTVTKVKAVENNSKLRVTAKLNEFSQRANDAWNMIKEGTLGYASLEMHELGSRIEKVGSKYVNLITDMDLGGWTLTSKPVNGNCVRVGMIAKAIDLSESTNLKAGITEDKKMTEEEKKAVEEPLEEQKPEVEEPKEEAEEEEKTANVEVKVKALEDKVKALETENVTLREGAEKIKSLSEDKELISSVQEQLVEKVKAALEEDDKVLVEAEQAKFEEKLKSMDEKMKAAESIDDKWRVAGEIQNELSK